MTLRGKVLAIGGAPLGKAEVTLRQLMQGALPRHYVAYTAADGLFAFADVEPGQYALNAERSGYVPAAYGSVNPMQGWTPLTVAPDRDLGELEFTLTPQAVITGRVFDADGDPFPGVRVLLLDAKNLRPRSGRIELTNDEGDFRIAGVAPGRYFLQAAVDSTRPGATVAYPDLYFPDVWDADEAQTIDVAMGARLGGFELRMRPARGYRIRGRVEWPPSAPPISRHISLNPKRSHRAGSGGRPTFVGETFDYPAVLPGSYMLSVMCESRQASLDLEVVDRDLDDLVVRFPHGVSVSGVVQPAGEFRFSLSGPSNPQAVTGADGSFTLQHVVAGEYRLHFWEIPNQGYVKTVRYRGIEMLPESIHINTGGRLEIELAFDSATVSGAVDPPRPGTLIRMWRGGVASHVTSADQDGRFEIRGIAPDEYLITAGEPPDEGEAVRVGPGERLTLTLPVR